MNKDIRRSLAVAAVAAVAAGVTGAEGLAESVTRA